MDITVFYDTCAYIYTAFGNFKKANEFLIKNINIYKNGNDIKKFGNIIELNLLELKTKEIGSYDSNIKEIISASRNFKSNEYKISRLIDTSIILAEKKDYENAKKLILKAEKYMLEPIHDGIQAKYYYAKGITEKEEISQNYF